MEDLLLKFKFNCSLANFYHAYERKPNIDQRQVSKKFIRKKSSLQYEDSSSLLN